MNGSAVSVKSEYKSAGSSIGSSYVTYVWPTYSKVVLSTYRKTDLFGFCDILS